jgi:hypothetical protein
VCTCVVVDIFGFSVIWLCKSGVKLSSRYCNITTSCSQKVVKLKNYNFFLFIKLSVKSSKYRKSAHFITVSSGVIWNNPYDLAQISGNEEKWDTDVVLFACVRWMNNIFFQWTYFNLLGSVNTFRLLLLTSYSSCIFAWHFNKVLSFNSIQFIHSFNSNCIIALQQLLLLLHILTKNK